MSRSPVALSLPRQRFNQQLCERLQLRRVVRGGVMCLELKGSLPPRQDGPPLHVHYQEYEEGIVVDLRGVVLTQITLQFKVC